MQGLWQKVYAAEAKAHRNTICSRMNIITLAYDMTKAVEAFMQKARSFFYHVMLLGYRCPKCNSQLNMVAESKCKCYSCGYDFDPTVEFQQCTACSGKIMLWVRRYRCQKCRHDVHSHFLFDGLVFDAEYFKAKMVESRQRKQEQRERVRLMLAESRSAALPLEAADLNSVVGLVEALNSLTAGLTTELVYEAKAEFDLNRYEKHIQTHIRDFPIRLTEIPPLNGNSRKDLIWRFVAILFLAHAGILNIQQDGQEILVIKHEINRKRQGVFGEFEESDGIERSMGGVEAW